jgi:hypothetical protein
MTTDQWNRFIELLDAGHLTFSGDPSGFHILPDSGDRNCVADCASPETSLVGDEAPTAPGEPEELSDAEYHAELLDDPTRDVRDDFPPDAKFLLRINGVQRELIRAAMVDMLKSKSIPDSDEQLLENAVVLAFRILQIDPEAAEANCVNDFTVAWDEDQREKFFKRN